MIWQSWLGPWRTPGILIAAVGVGYLAARLQWWWADRRSGQRQQARWQAILQSAASWQTNASLSESGSTDSASTESGPSDSDPSASGSTESRPADASRAEPNPGARISESCHDVADFESALLDQIDRLISHERRLQSDLRSARTLLHHRSAELKLSHAEARRDPLSALYNRRGFDEMLDSFLESRRYGRQFALIMVDVDHFKRINDVHGHMVGDRVLSWVGTRLMEVLRPTDCVARFGGDEFSILLREVTVEQARAVANRLLQFFRLQPFAAFVGPPMLALPGSSSPTNATQLSISQPGITQPGGTQPGLIQPHPVSIPVTLSLGVAVADPHETAEGLIRRADAALYQAKKDGRNRMFFDETQVRGHREPDRHLAVACPAGLSRH